MSVKIAPFVNDIVFIVFLWLVMTSETTNDFELFSPNSQISVSGRVCSSLSVKLSDIELSSSALLLSTLIRNCGQSYLAFWRLLVGNTTFSRCVSHRQTRTKQTTVFDDELLSTKTLAYIAWFPSSIGRRIVDDEQLSPIGQFHWGEHIQGRCDVAIFLSFSFPSSSRVSEASSSSYSPCIPMLVVACPR